MAGRSSKARARKRMNVTDAVRAVCLSFPEVEEVLGHGMPDFKVGGKTFATYALNHHGDGHVALWLRSPPGAQQLYTEMEPALYFVPPYVGPRGWLGVELNRGADWPTVTNRVREAYEEVAPPALTAQIGETTTLEGEVRPLEPEEVDPFLGKRARKIVQRLESICLELPEAVPALQFGSPVWKAGKKTFCGAHFRRGRLQAQFWVGVEQQPLRTLEERFKVPAFTGHNGWIELDVEDDVSWDEVQRLALDSYRHFALKRMLKALDG